MPWNEDRLAPVETLLFQSAKVKVGSFECAADDPCFPLSASLDNDVFVLPRNAVWVRRNAGEYRFAEAGAVLMHRAGSSLERRQASRRGERTYWFGVHPNLFVDTLRRHRLCTLRMGSALIAGPRLRYRMAVLLRQLKTRPRSGSAIEKDVLMLFAEICARRAAQQRRSNIHRPGTVARQRHLVDRTRAYLDQRLTENVSLQSVADDVGTSLYHLCRIFRAETGLTMHAYRTRQRLGRVVDKLVSGAPDNLSALALDAGFASHSHLSRVFRQQTGVPPSAMRD